jgi:ribosome biogenesis GTPase A
MTKTKRMIADNIKLVDIVLELRDARIPQSSQNPDISRLCSQKPRVIILNKSDMADPNANRHWVDYFKANDIDAILCDSTSGSGFNDILPAVKRRLSDKLERFKERGIQKLNIRAMVVGIPNVGKSSFINRLAGERRAKVEDRPGVTRAKQWITTLKELDLLDTPGILWPKFDDPEVALNLAFTGAIKDDIMDLEMLACKLLELLRDKYSDCLKDRYKMTDIENLEGHELLDLLCKKRGFLLPGGVFDTERGAHILIDEFRGVKLGRITLELP